MTFLRFKCELGALKTLQCLCFVVSETAAHVLSPLGKMLCRGGPAFPWFVLQRDILRLKEDEHTHGSCSPYSCVKYLSCVSIHVRSGAQVSFDMFTSCLNSLHARSCTFLLSCCCILFLHPSGPTRIKQTTNDALFRQRSAGKRLWAAQHKPSTKHCTVTYGDSKPAKENGC